MDYLVFSLQQANDAASESAYSFSSFRVEYVPYKCTTPPHALGPYSFAAVKEKGRQQGQKVMDALSDDKREMSPFILALSPDEPGLEKNRHY